RCGYADLIEARSAGCNKVEYKTATDLIRFLYSGTSQTGSAHIKYYDAGNRRERLPSSGGVP
ncbi:hypothetical protein, partial [Citrobacter braakii]|uniref:hypothetical protein n=1 Tax=Citrobacter braakii TaxID=57706 RepID=UPI001B801431